MIAKNNIPLEKMTVGVLFNGVGWKGVGKVNNGLYQRANGKSSLGTRFGGIFDYYDIKANFETDSGFSKLFHPESLVPYLFNPKKENGLWISYEDPQSIENKMKWIAGYKGKNKSYFNGTVIWDLSGDDDN